MSRIFFSLGVMAILMMAVTVSLGLYLRDYNLQFQQVRSDISELKLKADQDAGAANSIKLIQENWRHLQGWFRVHMLLGVATSLTVILVNCIGVTYFIGTGRWCREVAETYQLDPALPARSQRLKRRSFPWATLGILTALAISALGAAADPGTLRPNTETWTTPHMVAALAGLLLIAWGFFMQWGNIAEHHAVIEEITARVGEIRRQRGLDT